MDESYLLVDTFPETEYSYDAVASLFPYIISKEMLDSRDMFDETVISYHYAEFTDYSERKLVEQYYENMSAKVYSILKWKRLDVVIKRILRDYDPYDCEITKDGTLYLEFILR